MSLHNNNMSTSLEISIQADEWLDITTLEEVLQNDLDRLKEVLRVRDAELEASNVLTRELSSHTYALETERNALQQQLKEEIESFVETDSKLKETVAGKEEIEQEYNESKVSSAARIALLEQELLTTNNNFSKEVADLKKRLSTAETTSKAQIESLEKGALKNENNTSKVITDLKNKLSAQDIWSETQKEELTKTRSSLDSARKELAVEKKAAALTATQLALANKQLGSVAILAEDRKDERSSLERSVSQQKKSLTRATMDVQHLSSKIASLQKELLLAQYASEQRIKELESSVTTHEKDLQEARDELKGKQGSFKAGLKELQGAREEIKELQGELVVAKEQASALIDELEDSKAQVGVAQDALEAQKIKYERRLDEIRSALGFQKDRVDLISQPLKSLSMIFSGLNDSK
jgi:chromosome segregation ATPase